MKTLSLILILILSVFSTQSTDFEKEPAYSNVYEFLEQFEQAVLAGDSDAVLQFMDEGYIDIQLGDLHEGNTERFINEFFCGWLPGQQSFDCIPLNEIESIERTNLSLSDGHGSVSYQIRSGDTVIEPNWTIVASQKNGKRVFGLYGAVG